MTTALVSGRQTHVSDMNCGNVGLPSLLEAFDATCEDRCVEHQHIANRVCLQCQLFVCAECMDDDHEGHESVSVDRQEGATHLHQILKQRYAELDSAESKLHLQKRRLLMAGKLLLQQTTICKTVIDQFFADTNRKRGKDKLTAQVDHCMARRMSLLEKGLKAEMKQSQNVHELRRALSFLVALPTRQQFRALSHLNKLQTTRISMDIPNVNFHILTCTHERTAALVQEDDDVERKESGSEKNLSASLATVNLSENTKPFQQTSKSSPAKLIKYVETCLASTDTITFSLTDIAVGHSGAVYVTDGPQSRVVRLHRAGDKDSKEILEASWHVRDDLTVKSLVINEDEKSAVLLCEKDITSPTSSSSVYAYSLATIALEPEGHTPERNAITDIVDVAPSITQLDRICRAARSGILLVTSLPSGCMYKLSDSGEVIGVITTGLVMPHHMSLIPVATPTSAISSSLFISSSPSSSPTGEDDTEKILVADTVSGFLSVSIEGDVMGSIVKVGQGETDAVCPWTVAVSPHSDWVAVGDMGRECVRAYSLKGAYLGEVCRGVKPCAMAVSEEGALVVADSSKGKVYTYLLGLKERKG